MAYTFYLSTPQSVLVDIISLHYEDLSNMQMYMEVVFFIQIPGLGSLKSFSTGTHYLGDQYYTADVFLPLKNVTKLSLICIYPNQLQSGFLQHMQKIEELTLVLGMNASFGREFSHLKHLKYLAIKPGPKIMFKGRLTNIVLNISDDTLANVAQIKKLLLEDCLAGMSPYALRAFHNLKELHLIKNRGFPLEMVFAAIRNMRNATLTKLMLDGSHNNMIGVTAKMVYSTNFANINTLSVQNTRIVHADHSCLFEFPNLRNLNFGFNSIFSGKYVAEENSESLISLLRNPQNMSQFMNSLKVESISLNNLYAPVQDGEFRQIYSRNKSVIYPRPPKWIKIPRDLGIKRTAEDFIGMDTRQTLKFIPPSLRFIFAMNIPSIFIKMHPTPDTALDNGILYVDLSNTKVPQNVSLLIGFKRLQGIDLASCGIKYIHPDQLLCLPNLRYLNMTKNRLNPLAFDHVRKQPSKLRWLDLSFNGWRSLPPNLLSGLTSLHSVSFQGNPLLTLALNINDNKKLRMLDFSDCTLLNISDSFMNQLDSLQSNLSYNVKINLSGNQFDCTCASLNMIQWFHMTEVDIIDRDAINCTYKGNSTAIMTLDFDEVSKECGPPPVHLSTILTPVSLIFVLSIILALVYHFQWHLRRFIYRSKRQLRLYLRKPQEEILLGDLQFDLFVSHDHSDADWVNNELFEVIEETRGFRMCLPQRDFVGGVPITENIAEAIEKSRKTLLVVTPAFVQSKWCILEMHMARLEGLHTIIIVYKEPVELKDMCKTLRKLIKTVTYIEYPENDAGMEAFWDRLSRAISKNL